MVVVYALNLINTNSFVRLWAVTFAYMWSFENVWKGRNKGIGTNLWKSPEKRKDHIYAFDVCNITKGTVNSFQVIKGALRIWLAKNIHDIELEYSGNSLDISKPNFSLSEWNLY